MKLINTSLTILGLISKVLCQDNQGTDGAITAPRVEPQAEPEAEPEASVDASTQDVLDNTFINERRAGTFDAYADATMLTALLKKSCDGNDMCNTLVNNLEDLESGNALQTRSTEEILSLRKLKQLKVLILWLQPEHRFARYCFYGCWCLPDREHKLFTVGYGKPVDNIDGSCQRQSKCYECAKMDHPNRNCDPSDVGYGYKLHYDPLDPGNHLKKSITCTDDASKGGKHSCKRSICECDKKLSEDLREHFYEYYEGHHQEQGSFDAGANCLVEGCASGNCGPKKVECCGNLGHGTRMPFKSDGRRMCCGDKTYDSTFQECCEGNVLAAIGTC